MSWDCTTHMPGKSNTQTHVYIYIYTYIVAMPMHRTHPWIMATASSAVSVGSSPNVSWPRPWARSERNIEQSIGRNCRQGAKVKIVLTPARITEDVDVLAMYMFRAKRGVGGGIAYKILRERERKKEREREKERKRERERERERERKKERKRGQIQLTGAKKSRP